MVLQNSDESYDEQEVSMGVGVALPIGLNRIQDLNGRNDEIRMRISSGMLIAGNNR